MIHDPLSGSLKPFDFGHMSEYIPELERFNASIHSETIGEPHDSSNTNPEIWYQIAQKIYSNYSKYDGFVLLHGSDTMAYTASALSFMLIGLEKPVVLTGSQLPAGAIRTDAKENLITAIEIACERTHVVPEVCILFDYQLYRGNRATKFSSEKFQAFLSVNYPVLAEAGVHIKYSPQYFLKSEKKNLEPPFKLNTQVAILKLFPGISIDHIHAVLGIKNLKGLVLETFGSGNTTTDPEFILALETAIQKGLIVLDVTQCLGGKVELGKYETSIQLKRIGVASGIDITTEAAIAKLMYLFGKNLSRESVMEQLEKSLCGEFSV